MIQRFKEVLRNFTESRDENIIRVFINELNNQTHSNMINYLLEILEKNKKIRRLQKELKSLDKKREDLSQLIEETSDDCFKLLVGKQNMHENIDTFYVVNNISKLIEKKFHVIERDVFFDTREKAEEYVDFLQKISIIGTKITMKQEGQFNDGHHNNNAKHFYNKGKKEFYNFDDNKIWTVKGYGYFDYIDVFPLLEREAIKYNQDDETVVIKFTEWIIPSIDKFNFKFIKFI